MTLVGRIFLILLFVASAGFLWLALAVTVTHRNYKNEVEANPSGLKNQVSDLDTKVRKVAAENEVLRQELAEERGASRIAIAVLETARNDALANLNRTSAELTRSQEALATINAAKDKNAETLLAYQERNKDLLAERKQLQFARDELLVAQNNLVQSLHLRDGDFVNLRDQRDSLAGELDRATAHLQAKDIALYDPPPGSPDPRFDVFGEISAIGATGLVVVTLGRDDDLRPGARLHVYDQSGYSGLIEIKDANFHRAIGEAVPGHVRRPFKIGDRVTNNLSALKTANK